MIGQNLVPGGLVNNRERLRWNVRNFPITDFAVLLAILALAGLRGVFNRRYDYIPRRHVNVKRIARVLSEKYTSRTT